MTPQFKKWIKKNNIVEIELLDTETEFMRCDATGQMAHCLRVSIYDKDGFGWMAYLTVNEVADFKNKEDLDV